MSIYILKIVCAQNCNLIGKLVLACEDEILKTTETWHDNKEVRHDLHYLQDSHDLIDNYLLLVIITIIQIIGLSKNIYYHIRTPAIN